MHAGTARLLADPAPGSLRDVHGEDGMASIRLLVEVVHGRRPHELAAVKKVERLLLRLHLHLRESPDEDAPPRSVFGDDVFTLREIAARAISAKSRNRAIVCAVANDDSMGGNSA